MNRFREFVLAAIIAEYSDSEIAVDDKPLGPDLSGHHDDGSGNRQNYPSCHDCRNRCRQLPEKTPEENVIYFHHSTGHHNCRQTGQSN